MDVEDLIRSLRLQQHPEGGFFRETFRSSVIVGTPRGPRAASTAIYYLLPAGALSALHRVRSDEVWHHYGGEPLELHRLDEAGHHQMVRLGDEPQVIVPAGVWQAAVGPSSGYALCGCTVAPGFDFADWELPSRAELTARFPAHAPLIARLTHSTRS
jgi:predicted cupin superfamily sugar epimerase